MGSLRIVFWTLGSQFSPQNPFFKFLSCSVKLNGGRGGRGSGRGTRNNNNENPDFETIIAQQLQGLLPTIITQVGDRMSNQGNNVSMNEHADNDDGDDHANNGNYANGNKGCTYMEFSACKPVDFDGNGGAIVYTRWVEKMESVIDISECMNHQKIKYAACSLNGKALTWCNTQIQARGREATMGMSWDDFKALLMEEYCPDNEMQKLEHEFYHHAMVRAGHTAYTDRFHELARLVPHMVTPESKRIESW
ncbi:reverse transcriptase domain-containing protein [Artemisia annua]|uniref:Reverse transcriptase domain-containing protein n=1 Tax=Artemisia annua TaxID=35608 RepID=A0A2U1QDV7_ARTAN|nr:reverse transcriptase domain-containing protein [Artemisia annua]